MKSKEIKLFGLTNGTWNKAKISTSDDRNQWTEFHSAQTTFQKKQKVYTWEDLTDMKIG